jgi:GntR family transcriptional regulator
VSVLPLYHRLFLLLRDQIVNGVYDRREPMPGENQLAAKYGVSRTTIRKALELLEEEQLIERRQGAPTYAKPLGYDGSKKRQNLDRVARERSYLDLYSGDVQQHYEIVTADKILSRQFNNLKQLGRICRVRETDGKPWSFVVTYMPLEISAGIDWQQLGSKAVISAVLEQGVSIDRVEQAIGATVADEETGAAMGVSIGSPLLRVSGMFVDKDGAAVMRKDGYFHPESFEYRVTLSFGAA